MFRPLNLVGVQILVWVFLTTGDVIVIGIARPSLLTFIWVWECICMLLSNIFSSRTLSAQLETRGGLLPKSAEDLRLSVLGLPWNSSRLLEISWESSPLVRLRLPSSDDSCLDDYVIFSFLLVMDSASFSWVWILRPSEVMECLLASGVETSLFCRALIVAGLSWDGGSFPS